MNPKSLHDTFLKTNHSQKRSFFSSFRVNVGILLTTVLLLGITAGCDNVVQRRDVRPLVMRDVPAQRLAYRLESDTGLPSDIKSEDLNDKVAEIQADFNKNRKDDALLRTVVSPDGRRALALYATSDEPNEAFRIDLYAVEGQRLRNLTPPALIGAFPETAAWSPDGNYITFIAHKSMNLAYGS